MKISDDSNCKHRAFSRGVCWVICNLLLLNQFAAASTQNPSLSSKDPEAKENNSDGSNSNGWNICRSELTKFQQEIQANQIDVALRTLERLDATAKTLTDTTDKGLKSFRLETLMCTAISSFVKSGFHTQAENVTRTRLAAISPFLADGNPDRKTAIEVSKRLMGAFVKTEQARKNYEFVDHMIPDLIAFSKQYQGESSPAHAQTIKGVADLRNDMGRLKEAEQLYLEAIKLYKALGLDNERSIALMFLGDAYRKDGRTSDSKSAFQEALNLAKTNEYKLEILTELIKVYKASRDLDAVISARKQKIEVLREANASAFVVDEENYMLAGDLDLAEKYSESDAAFNESIRFLSSINPPQRKKIVRLMAESALVKLSLKKIADCDRLLQEAQKECDLQDIKDADWQELKLLCLSNKGVREFREKNYKQAAGLFRQALEMSEALGVKESSDDQAVRNSNIGEALGKSGQLAEAESYLRKTVDLYEQNPNPPVLCKALLELSYCLKVLGKRIEAVNLAQRAYNLCLLNKDKIDPTLVNRATRYVAEGLSIVSSSTEATPIWQQELESIDPLKLPQAYIQVALKISGNLINDNQLETAAILITKAEDTLRSARELDKSVSASLKHDVLSKKAHLMNAQHQMISAEKLFKEALTLSREKQPPDVSTVCGDLLNIALFYKNQGLTGEADKYVLEIERLDLARNKRDSLTIQRLMLTSESLIRHGKNDEAYKQLVEAMSMSDQTSPNWMKNEMHCLLGEVCLELKKSSEAESHFNSILRSPAARSSLQIRSLCSLAELYAARGELSEAKKLIESAPVDLNSDSISSWQDVVRVMLTRGKIEVSTRNYNEALSVEKRALQLALKYGGANVALAADLQRDIAATHIGMNNWVEAESALEKALSYYETIYGTSNLRYGTCLITLCRIKKKLSKNEECKALAAKAEEIFANKFSPDALIIKELRAYRQGDFAMDAIRTERTNNSLPPSFSKFCNDCVRLISLSQTAEALALCQKQLESSAQQGPASSLQQSCVLSLEALANCKAQKFDEANRLAVLALEKIGKADVSKSIEGRSFVYKNLAQIKERQKLFAEASTFYSEVIHALKAGGTDELNLFGLPGVETKYAVCLAALDDGEKTRAACLECAELLKLWAGRLSQIELKVLTDDDYRYWMRVLRNNAFLEEQSQQNDKYALYKAKLQFSDLMLELSKASRKIDVELSRRLLELAFEQLKNIDPQVYEGKVEQVSRELSFQTNLIGLEFSIRLGDLGKAREIYEFRLKNTPPNAIVKLAIENSSLAHITSRIGDLDVAESYANRSIQLINGSSDARALDVMSIYSVAAQVQELKGNLPEAIKLQRRVCQSLHSNEADIVTAQLEALCTLGYFLSLNGNLQEATDCWDQFRQQENKNPTAHASSFAMNNFMGAVFHLRRDFQSAEEAFLNMLELNAMIDDVFLKLDRIRILNMAFVNRDKQKKSASEFALDAAKSLDECRGKVQRSLPRPEQAIYISANMRRCINMLLTSGTEGSAIENIYPYLLRWKGLIVESIRSETSASKSLPVRQARAEVEKLRKDIEVLDNTPGSTARREELLALINAGQRRVREKLENCIQSDVIGDRPLESLQKALKPDEAFIDIYRYNKPSLVANSEESQYCAIISTKFQTLAPIPLGSAKVIDTSIEQWLDQMSGGVKRQRDMSLVQKKAAGPVDNTDVIAKQFSGLIWSKIGAKLQDQSTKLIVCPDSEFAKIPWDVLVNEVDLRSRQVAVADSPRLLVSARLSPTVPLTNRLIALSGAIAFKESPPLPQTEREVDDIERFAKEAHIQADVYKGTAPTKAKLLSVFPTATFIHLATHGFFASQEKQNEETTFQSVKLTKDASNREAVVKGSYLTRDPLTTSGIVVAPSPDDLDGIVTAEELVGIDMTKCDLFALSACQTALGESYTGQGVVGLRSALEAAGCKSVLLSLWKVDDDATRALMTRFYEELWKNPTAKVAALRTAQESVKSTKGWESPYYWGAWVLAGQAW